jgi:sialic acid synthase SpsE
MQAVRILKKVPYLAVMQNTAAYPPALTDLHVRVLKTYKAQFGLPLGYSCHNLWFQSALQAQAYGAEWFEFHFTRNRKQKGTDHKVSLLPNELKELYWLLESGKQALGTDEKKVLKCEQATIDKLRGDLCK